MKVIAAYMLAVLGGNSNPSADDIKTILASVGAEADAERVSALLKGLEGKNLDEVIAAGMEKVGSLAVATGGGGGGGGAGTRGQVLRGGLQQRCLSGHVGCAPVPRPREGLCKHCGWLLPGPPI
mmetsp:Transcript_135587/g.329597  ORF Transcript_135587/g.329597 Transcript_135587/m.329597 type:complete len:124 (-) Transcript_135587:539-910(-)